MHYTDFLFSDANNKHFQLTKPDHNHRSHLKFMNKNSPYTIQMRFIRGSCVTFTEIAREMSWVKKVKFVPGCLVLTYIKITTYSATILQNLVATILMKKKLTIKIEASNDQNVAYWQRGPVSIKTTDMNSLQWRHYERDGVSNHRRLYCLFNCFFRHRSKKSPKLCVTGLCKRTPRTKGQ